MRRTPELILDILIGLGLGVILLSPLPYASVETWSVSLFEIASFITLGLWCIREIFQGRLKIAPSPLYLPLGLFFILILIQLIPMPLSLLKIVSSNTYGIVEQSKEALIYIFGDAAINSFTISINPYTTKEKLILYLSYASVFIVASNYIVSRTQLRRVFWVIFSVGTLEAIIGIAQYVSSGITFPASGTFINPNHFGGLLLLIIPVSLSYTLYLSYRRGGRGSIVDIIRQSKFTNQLLILFFTCLMGTALIVSQSRGALISAVAAVAIFYLLLTWNRKNRPGTLFLVIFVIIIGIYSLWIGLDPVIEKFSETTETLPKRTLIWQDTVNIIKEFPILGTGLGTYSMSFSLYKDAAFWARIIQHAHNDYLELLSETGLVGFLLVMWGMFLFYKRAVAKIISRSQKMDPLRFYLLIGTVSGTLGMMVHVFTDFNFQIPANAYYFTFLLAISTGIINRYK